MTEPQELAVERVGYNGDGTLALLRIRLRPGRQTGTHAVNGSEARLVHYRHDIPVAVTFHYVEDGVDVIGLPMSQALRLAAEAQGVRVVGRREHYRRILSYWARDAERIAQVWRIRKALRSVAPILDIRRLWPR